MTTDLIKLLLLLVAVILFFVFVARPFEPIECRRNRNMSSTKVDGVIREKFENTSNNGTEKLVMTNGATFYWYDDFYGRLHPYEQFQIGDSVAKKDGSLLITIYRQDTSIVLDFTLPCDEQ